MKILAKTFNNKEIEVDVDVYIELNSTNNLIDKSLYQKLKQYNQALNSVEFAIVSKKLEEMKLNNIKINETDFVNKIAPLVLEKIKNIKKEQIQDERLIDTQPKDYTQTTNQKIDISTQKETPIKPVINHFTRELIQKAKDYKPPLMQIKMDLNPKNLGSLQLTITNRGKNLHIKINSNDSAVSLLSHNAFDIKTNLQNLGFKDVQFNFSSNQSNQQNSQQNNQHQNQHQQFQEQYKQNNEDEELEIILDNFIYG